MYLQSAKHYSQKFLLLAITLSALNPSFSEATTVSINRSIADNKSGSLNNHYSVPSTIFPLDNYDQNIDNWINPSDSNYQKPLVDRSYQQKRLEEFYQHYFSTETDSLSPWSQNYVLTQVNNPQTIQMLQKDLLSAYNNEGKNIKFIGYGVHFRPYNKDWIEKIAQNMNIDQFQAPIHFNANNRAIFVQNAYARSLPSQEPYYYHYSIPGEGYPFDQLQMSAIWTGTPAYIVGESKDKNWSLVLTPDFTCWVQSETLAKTNEQFITQWQRAAKNKLAAITQTETAIIDMQNKNHHFKAYVGSIFPLVLGKAQQYQILFPAKDPKGMAHIRRAILDKNHAAEMPLAATPENFVKLLKTLQDRPYGWGGLYFLNDCSSELKSIYTPFGFWLARHSSDQTKAGKMIDKKNLSTQEKIAYLGQQGRPFMTFVYNTKHVFMYLGNFSNPNAIDKKPVPMTYQNLWALRPLDDSRRAVVGKALLLPLLGIFPEDKALNSHANKDDFKIIYLDEWPESNSH